MVGAAIRYDSRTIVNVVKRLGWWFLFRFLPCSLTACSAIRTTTPETVECSSIEQCRRQAMIRCPLGYEEFKTYYGDRAEESHYIDDDDEDSGLTSAGRAMKDVIVGTARTIGMITDSTPWHMEFWCTEKGS